MKGESGEAYLKEKQGSPWGSRIKKGKKWKGERMEVWGEEEGVQDGGRREPKTRRAGMNINNILCWKIVTMDITERRQWKEVVYCLCRCK